MAKRLLSIYATSEVHAVLAESTPENVFAVAPFFIFDAEAQTAALHFQPSESTVGTASVTVTVVYSDWRDTLTLTDLLTVNVRDLDDPVFSMDILPEPVLVDTPEVVISGFLAIQANQDLTDIVLTSTNDALFASKPALSWSGKRPEGATLRYTPSEFGSGTSTLTVKIVYKDGAEETPVAGADDVPAD